MHCYPPCPGPPLSAKPLPEAGAVAGIVMSQACQFKPEGDIRSAIRGSTALQPSVKLAVPCCGKRMQPAKHNATFHTRWSRRMAACEDKMRCRCRLRFRNLLHHSKVRSKGDHTRISSERAAWCRAVFPSASTASQEASLDKGLSRRKSGPELFAGGCGGSRSCLQPSQSRAMGDGHQALMTALGDSGHSGLRHSLQDLDAEPLANRAGLVGRRVA